MIMGPLCLALLSENKSEMKFERVLGEELEYKPEAKELQKWFCDFRKTQMEGMFDTYICSWTISRKKLFILATNKK